MTGVRRYDHDYDPDVALRTLLALISPGSGSGLSVERRQELTAEVVNKLHAHLASGGHLPRDWADCPHQYARSGTGPGGVVMEQCVRCGRRQRQPPSPQ